MLKKKDKAALDSKLHSIIISHLTKIDEYVYKGQQRKQEISVSFENDPLYSIFGLNSPEYIAAALSGGIITSIHRKIGDAYEECVREIVAANFSLTHDQISYSAPIASGTATMERSLDCLLRLSDCGTKAKSRVLALAQQEINQLTQTPRITIAGIGFEIRHCYQSADSKRAQADEAMARHLLVSGFVPIMLVFCNQSNQSILHRYRATWIVKEGMDSYNLVRQLTGYDYYGFLNRHKADFQPIVRRALRKMR